MKDNKSRKRRSRSDNIGDNNSVIDNNNDISSPTGGKPAIKTKRSSTGSGYKKGSIPSKVATPFHATSNKPTYLSDYAGTSTLNPVAFDLNGTNGQLISRVTLQHVKLSPTGEENSLIRTFVADMVTEIKSRLVASNIDYATKSNLSMLTVSALDEYMEMVTNFVVSYCLLSQLYALSRYEITGANEELVRYAQISTSSIRGFSAMLSNMREQIRTFLLPPNMLELIVNRSFGIYSLPNTNSTPGVTIIGAQIPTNYESYAFKPERNPFAPQYTTHPLTESVSEWTPEYANYGDHLGYNPEHVLHIPPIDSTDVAKMQLLAANMTTWTSVNGGVFQNVTRMLGLIVPGWQMKTFSYRYDQVPVITTEIATWIRNFGIVNIKPVGNVDEENNEYTSNSPLSTNTLERGGVIEYVCSENERLTLYYLFMLWHTIDLDGVSTAYPGLFLRLVSRNSLSEGSVASNCRYLIRRDGSLKLITEFQDQITLQQYWNYNTESDSIYKHTRLEDDIQTVPSQNIDDRTKMYVKFLYNFEDVLSSPMFRAPSITNN